MNDSNRPDPECIFSVQGCRTMTYVKPTTDRPNMEIGEFCQIGTDVELVMNG